MSLRYNIVIPCIFGIMHPYRAFSASCTLTRACYLSGQNIAVKTVSVVDKEVKVASRLFQGINIYKTKFYTTTNISKGGYGTSRASSSSIYTVDAFERSQYRPMADKRALTRTSSNPSYCQPLVPTATALRHLNPIIPPTGWKAREQPEKNGKWIICQKIKSALC